ncbi:hypothetical protein AKJ52_00625 [candidate division MSBL1 archaeon SCGC-AAA382C18]|uniref:HTH marR-type domain-containing protein n=1 Tax=candidate division MSBL1 archaeon SCGC-AAA382C18 TaxID=1698281 RepID=A0A133VLF3_9EURY|nr:hypothetical protein AKJ52_00625 [candidate division MSBL1 archaeon SCGC-AAA382C18]
MPISVDEFEKAPENALEVGEETNGEKVLNFLLKNPDKAFTRSEIMESTGVKAGSIGVTLSRLEKKGLLRHKGNYWTLAPDDKIATLSTELYGTEIANKSLGTEEEKDWLEDQ